VHSITKNIVPIYKGDIPHILEIERISYPSIQTEKALVKAFRAQEVRGVKIEDRNGKIVGFMMFRCFMLDVFEIWFLTISPKSRRMGHGSSLIEYLMKRLSNLAHGWGISIKVNEYNLTGQLFLQSCGFRCEGIVRQCCSIPDEEAQNNLLMVYRKPSCPHNRLQSGGGFDVTDV